MEAPLRVSVLENQLLFRERLVDVLVKGGVEVVGQYSNPDDFLAHVTTDRPTVGLADLGFRSGEALLVAARQRHPGLRLLVLANAGEPSSSDCYREGAAGWLDTREATGENVLAAVSAVARGQRLFPLELMGSGEKRAPESPMVASLSLRERQVLSCVAAGSDNLKIASILGISERTVKAHMSKLYLKLGAENRTQLALLALQLGIKPAQG